METLPNAAGSAAAFDLSGGHPALDLVNTLDNRFEPERAVERLAEYGDLLRFVEQTGLMQGARARQLARLSTAAGAARALRSARELREALATMLYGGLAGRAPRDAELRCLEEHFHEADAHRQLRWGAAGPHASAPALSWGWGDSRKEPELPVWMLAHAAAALMLSGAREQIRACGAETCRWLFLDTSKNHTRRWCNMKVCGNRMKARRFQARHAD